ncbi:hypothetical protein L1987_18462 [Smallanthus sonchifolius]|uniref:Uncharacterized protein n=1 Tax=Smallanthus sonchifolius TaxID=185202 RepID=A0ACB9J1V5_9ASTR|nr:hypothetical protein L1987_18462 [Smallanthus sonchifolius]
MQEEVPEVPVDEIVVVVVDNKGKAVMTYKDVQLPKKPKVLVITFSSKKSIPRVRSYLKKSAETPKSPELMKFKTPTKVPEIKITDRPRKEELIAFLKPSGFHSKQFRNVKVETLRKHAKKFEKKASQDNDDVEVIKNHKLKNHMRKKRDTH